VNEVGERRLERFELGLKFGDLLAQFDVTLKVWLPVVHDREHGSVSVRGSQAPGAGVTDAGTGVRFSVSGVTSRAIG
jgi:hypothetical protein